MPDGPAQRPCQRTDFHGFCANKSVDVFVRHTKDCVVTKNPIRTEFHPESGRNSHLNIVT